MTAVSRLVGVYDADGSRVGELTYFVRARVGLAHCALCDITHGRVRERPEWRAWRARLPVPFETYHRDDQPAGIRAAATRLPTVLAEKADGTLVEVADAEVLASCAGDPDRLRSHIEESFRRHGLTWAVGDHGT